MPLRDEMEKALAEIRRRREDSEAEAGRAAKELISLASGATPLSDVDAEAVRAAADTYADAVTRLRELEAFARMIRGLLI